MITLNKLMKTVAFAYLVITIAGFILIAIYLFEGRFGGSNEYQVVTVINDTNLNYKVTALDQKNHKSKFLIHSKKVQEATTAPSTTTRLTYIGISEYFTYVFSNQDAKKVFSIKLTNEEMEARRATIRITQDGIE